MHDINPSETVDTALSSAFDEARMTLLSASRIPLCAIRDDWKRTIIGRVLPQVTRELKLGMPLGEIRLRAAARMEADIERSLPVWLASGGAERVEDAA